MVILELIFIYIRATAVAAAKNQEKKEEEGKQQIFTLR